MMHESMVRNRNTGVISGIGGIENPLTGILSKFSKPAEAAPVSAIPSTDERCRLMLDCFDRCRRRWTGAEPDWQEVDRINSLIGKTYDRVELVGLLAEFETAMTTAQVPL